MTPSPRTFLLLSAVLSMALVFSACKTSEPGHGAEEDGSFRMMSYNIKHGQGMDGNIDLERTADVIREADADIVALQEVDVGVERSGRRDIAKELSDLTGLEYHVFGKNLDHEGGDYGNATLSKYPIIEDNNTHFEQVGPEQRGVLQTVIDVQGRNLLVLNTHLDYSEDDTERLLYVEGIREEIIPAFESDGVVVAGDFNDTPGSSTHLKMKEFMTDAWETSGEGEGLTASSNDPQRRIDYVFYDNKLTAADAWVPVTMASDHLPVVVEFEIAQ